MVNAYVTVLVTSRNNPFRGGQSIDSTSDLVLTTHTGGRGRARSFFGRTRGGSGRRMESHTPSLEGKYQVRQSVKVLIVDEEASQRSGLAAMVSAWGMTTNTASDGNDALAKLKDFRADVIITDLNMSGMGGFGLLERLRDSEEMPPTIVL